VYAFTPSINIHAVRSLTHSESIKQIVVSVVVAEHEIFPGIIDVILENPLQSID